MFKAFLFENFSDPIFKIFITHTLGLESREKISNQALEQWNIVVNEFWHVHISEGSHQHDVFREIAICSLEGACHN